MKLNIYITDPELFLKDPDSDCFAALTSDHMTGTWDLVDTVDIHVPISPADLVEKAQAALNEKLLYARQLVRDLELRKAELLALPSPVQHTYEGTCELCEGVCHAKPVSEAQDKINRYDETRRTTSGSIKDTRTGEVYDVDDPRDRDQF